jgi:uncharacterized YccA/Bax inhibitor family protein
MLGLARTSNLALNATTFDSHVAEGSESMTLQGTVNKTGVLLLCLCVSSAWSWNLARSESPTDVLSWAFIASICGVIVALITIYMKEFAPFTSPLYALLQGVALGGASSLIDWIFPGVAIHAVELTIAILGMMLLAYASGVVPVTEKFKIGLFAATGGIALVYFIDSVLSFFGMRVPLIHDAGPWGIVVSLVIVAVAALNLLQNFDLIVTGVDQHAAKYMEWYGAFALMVTLIWLYVEMLRLVAKVRRR